MQTNLLQCAAYGLSTYRLTPHPFNFCSNASSTHTSISQTQPLYMTLSMCTQFLWSTMARPVLSGTRPVKPLYGLGHRAAAQFQGLVNLLIAYARAVRYDNIYRIHEMKSLLFHIMFHRLFRGVAKYIVYGNTFSSFEWLRSLYAAHHGAWRGDRSRWRTTSQGKTRSLFLNKGLHLKYGHAFLSTAVLKQPILSYMRALALSVWEERAFSFFADFE